MTMLAYRRFGVGAYSKRSKGMVFIICSKGMVFIIWLMRCGNFKCHKQNMLMLMRNPTYLM
jgi:hypothetical protein